jgi:hypothetical protein
LKKIGDELLGKKRTKPLTGETPYFHRKENLFVLLLCVLAGLRIFFYSAAFPVFNNVDEPAHFDLIYKYAGGHIPERIETYSGGSADLILIYGSPEYHDTTGTILQPSSFSMASPEYEVYKKHILRTPNIESTEPPVYYTIAASWYRLGKFFGLNGAAEIYWIRFLNIPICMLMVWLSYFCIKRLFPDNAFLKFSLPLLVTIFPQSILFGMNNDVLSPLVFSLAFFGLIEISFSEKKSWLLYLWTGCAIALAVLTKITNLAILAVFCFVMAYKIGHFREFRAENAIYAKVAILISSTVLPVILWYGRNYLDAHTLPDFSEKTKLLGWTLKPFSQIWDHPFFSIKGVINFWNDLLAAFWGGEFVWHMKLLSSDLMDLFYSVSSLFFILIFIIFILLPHRETAKDRLIHWLSFIAIVVSISVLLIVSLAYDFHDCIVPSRQYPFNTAGRLISGMLIPFLIVYLSGLNFVLDKLGIRSMREVVVCLIALTIVFSEFALYYPVLKSPYNWFHAVSFW